ncbi:hypothetical protein M8J76_010313 [Diaphorina citri]|nr:hypothetical protein M8J76_010313 [Diaphorina citri]
MRRDGCEIKKKPNRSQPINRHCSQRKKSKKSGKSKSKEQRPAKHETEEGGNKAVGMLRKISPFLKKAKQPSKRTDSSQEELCTKCGNASRCQTARNTVTWSEKTPPGSDKYSQSRYRRRNGSPYFMSDMRSVSFPKSNTTDYFKFNQEESTKRHLDSFCGSGYTPRAICRSMSSYRTKPDSDYTSSKSIYKPRSYMSKSNSASIESASKRGNFKSTTKLGPIPLATSILVTKSSCYCSHCLGMTMFRPDYCKNFRTLGQTSQRAHPSRGPNNRNLSNNAIPHYNSPKNSIQSSDEGSFRAMQGPNRTASSSNNRMEYKDDIARDDRNNYGRIPNQDDVTNTYSRIPNQDDTRNTKSRIPNQDDAKNTYSTIPNQDDTRNTKSRIPNQDDARNTYSRIPNQDDTRNTKSRIPNQDDARNTYSTIPNQDDTRNTKSRIPNQDDARNTYSTIPNQDDTRNTKSRIPNQDDARNTYSTIPNQDDTRNTKSRIPNQDDARNTYSRIPNQDDATNAYSSIPNQDDTRNTKSRIPNQDDARNTKSRIPNQDDARNTYSRIPNQDDTRNTKSRIPNQDDARNTYSRIPNQDDARNTYSRIPNQDDTRNTYRRIPNQDDARNTYSRILNQDDARNTYSRIPNQDDTRNTYSRIPNQDDARNTYSKIPNQDDARNTYSRIPNKDDARNTYSKIPNQGDTRNTYSRIPNQDDARNTYSRIPNQDNNYSRIPNPDVYQIEDDYQEDVKDFYATPGKDNYMSNQIPSKDYQIPFSKAGDFNPMRSAHESKKSILKKPQHQSHLARSNVQMNNRRVKPSTKNTWKVKIATDHSGGEDSSLTSHTSVKQREIETEDQDEEDYSETNDEEDCAKLRELLALFNKCKAKNKLMNVRISAHEMSSTTTGSKSTVTGGSN